MALRRRGLRGQRSHELFPGFTDVREIGVGSLAVVFRAREIATNRHVALKLLNVRDASPRAIESFERESIALGTLSSHPNIVTLYRMFRTADGRPVLVLEFCPGVVSDRLRGGTGLPVADAVSIGIKIAGALETAHRAGILHRDVKPQNILITEFGEPALADFGVAMLQSSTQTTAGLFDFTTLHAAPELLEGGGTSAATDVYELASSLYQLIAGVSAFRAHEGESPASVILRILRDPVRPLSGAEIPSALSDLLLRAMAKQQDARPPTAAEFAAELSRIESVKGWPRTQFLISGAPPAPESEQDSTWTRPTIVAPAVPPPPRQPAPTPPPTPPPASPQTPAPATPTAPAAPAPAVPVPPTLPPPPRELPLLPRDVPPAPEPTPEPTPEERPHRRVPIDIDDEYFPARPHGLQQPPRPEPPVPVWAVREPNPPGDERAPDDSTLPGRTTLRAGASSLAVDADGLHVRNWFKRSSIGWAEINGFEAQLDSADSGLASKGQIVALTDDGPVELRGTRRPLAELRHVHALLDGYRARAR